MARKNTDTPDPGLLLTAWNENRGKLPVALGLPGTRRTHVLARLREEPNIFVWESAIERLSRSSFANGENDRKWVATIDFLIRPDTLTKIREGVYDNKDAAPQVSAARELSDSEAEEIVATERRRTLMHRSRSADPEISARAKAELAAM